MALQLCVLGSGSSGNSIYVGSEQTGILIDAGFSARETARRLEAAGLDAARLAAICVSHEHNDHTAGVRVLHRRHRIPLYGNAGTVEGILRDPKMRELPWNIFTTGSSFQIGDLTIEPFSVPHDAYDPVGFVVRSGPLAVGIATDLGLPTQLVRERLRSCQAVVLESNHDERLLQEAERPWVLKQRIMGRQGHLSNRGAADLLADIAGHGLTRVLLAHLSEECNRRELALRTIREKLERGGHGQVQVDVTHPDRISEMICLEEEPL